MTASNIAKSVENSNAGDIFDGLRNAMLSFGLSPPDNFIIGDWTRCEDALKETSNADGSYRVWPKGTGYRAVFKSWRRPDDGNQHWNSGDNNELTEEDFEELENSRERQRRELESKYAQARLRAIDEWSSARQCRTHPYLTQKNVPPHGLRSKDGMLVARQSG